MINEQTVLKYFSREQIIKNLTSYVLYYQVSLGRNVYETMQDQQATMHKLKELNLTLEPNEILMSLLEIILAYGNEEDFDKNFDKYLQRKALLESIKDFVKKDSELLNKENYLSAKQQKILSDSFFDSGMKMQYLSEYPNMFKHYEKIIDDQYVSSVQETMLNSIQ